jgi:hypothetical protein
MNDQLMILLGGIHSLCFAFFHMQFWRLFNWKDDLNQLQPINKAIIQIANIRLIYFFLFVATICFIFPIELSTTSLGKFFLGGMSLFWIGRTIEQFVFLKIEHRYIHLLTYLFILGAVLFAIPLLVNNYE